MRLAERLEQDGYDGYAYSYPHKTAYRPLEPAVPLAQAWRDEDKSRLFLYVHLPFCEMRCGFCNLFTTVRPPEDLVERTLSSIARQARVVAECLAPEGVAQAALGGGTPSYLSEVQLERLFSELSRHWPVDWSRVPVSVELSPATVTAGKLSLLRALGVERVSLGVQSFVATELAALKRPQEPGEVERACAAIRAAGFAVFNLDLIYGQEGQTAASWEESLERALRWQPEELYLYPLYVGKRTNLDVLGKRPGARRQELYHVGRERLLAAGYRQLSMRSFRRLEVQRSSDYCCQEDGMVGLGPGARSYTRALHYSSEYAVAQTGVRRIVGAFAERDFSQADYGVRLDASEQKLRWLIKSLLRAEGVALSGYRERFASSLEDDHPRLQELFEAGLAERDEGRLRLTEQGLARSDTLGPWLYSESMSQRMASYAGW